MIRPKSNTQHQHHHHRGTIVSQLRPNLSIALFIPIHKGVTSHKVVGLLTWSGRTRPYSGTSSRGSCPPRCRSWWTDRRWTASRPHPGPCANPLLSPPVLARTHCPCRPVASASVPSSSWGRSWAERGRSSARYFSESAPNRHRTLCLDFSEGENTTISITLGQTSPRGHHFTFLGLRVRNLQVKVHRLAEALLVDDGLLEVRHGDVQPIERDGVEIERTLELVVDRHCGGGPRGFEEPSDYIDSNSWRTKSESCWMGRTLTVSTTRVMEIQQCFL